MVLIVFIFYLGNPSCKACSAAGAGNCTQCAGGNIPVNGFCTSCPSGTYQDLMLNACIPCKLEVAASFLVVYIFALLQALQAVVFASQI